MKIFVAGLALLAALLFVFRHPKPAQPDAAEVPGSLSAVDETSRDAPKPASGVPSLDRTRADAVRQRLQALWLDAAPAGSPSDDPQPLAKATSYPDMPTGGVGDPEGLTLGGYIQSVVHEQFFPLAMQCYQTALARHPKLAGQVELHFRIVGDKRVGGVVDEVSPTDAGSISEPDFVTCMTESMMSVAFDAPPHDSGQVTVTYPFSFSPDGESHEGRPP